jgi:hypothetical protein
MNTHISFVNLLFCTCSFAHIEAKRLRTDVTCLGRLNDTITMLETMMYDLALVVQSTTILTVNLSEGTVK